MRSFIGILTLCFATTLFGVEPNAVITGPTSANVGDMIVLSSKGSTYDKGGCRWIEISDNGKFVFAVGEQIAFASGTPTTYHVVLVCAGMGSDGVNHESIVDSTIVVGGSPIPPGPGPGPDPPPNPPVPPTPSKYGLDSFTSNLMRQLPATATGISPAIAQSYRTIAAGIVAPNSQYTTPQQIITATYKANVAIEGSLAPAWRPVFVPLAGQLNTMYTNKSFQTMADYAEAWNEIADGISPKSSLNFHLK